MIVLMPDWALPPIPDPQCHRCLLRRDDVWTCADPSGGLADLCRPCRYTLRRDAAERRERRTALEALAREWTGDDDDCGTAGELLRRTGLPLAQRWAAHRDLVRAAASGDDRRADAALDALTGVRA